MLVTPYIPIQRIIKCPPKPPVAAVENCGEIPSHLPQYFKETPSKISKQKNVTPPKPVSFPPTLGGNVDLKA